MKTAQSKLVASAITLAAPLTLWAVVANSITVAGGDHSSVILQATVCSALALALLAWAWTRGSWFGRLVSAVFILCAGLTLLDAGGRRLLGLWGG